jgi:hypothetical protein
VTGVTSILGNLFPVDVADMAAGISDEEHNTAAFAKAQVLL